MSEKKGYQLVPFPLPTHGLHWDTEKVEGTLHISEILSWPADCMWFELTLSLTLTGNIAVKVVLFCFLLCVRVLSMPQNHCSFSDGSFPCNLLNKHCLHCSSNCNKFDLSQQESPIFILKPSVHAEHTSLHFSIKKQLYNYRLYLLQNCYQAQVTQNLPFRSSIFAAFNSLGD